MEDTEYMDKDLAQWNVILREQGYFLKQGKKSVAVHKLAGEFIFRCKNLKEAINETRDNLNVDLTR